MRTNKLWLPIVFAFAVASAASCHNTQSTNPQSPEQARQSAIAAQAYQINHSNLPPDQKQRLLSRIGAK